jgi:UDP-2-acetamido-3-amino-2,3-dideoxy-glucuronate N-acetyltransferase
MSPICHPSAVVDDGAQIGVGTRIWHFTHVSAGSVIGKGCSIGQNVFIGNRARLGDGVKIQNNVSVYDDVVLENNVFCGPSAVFTNVVNPRANIERKNEYRLTRVCEGATLGANCTIVCGVTLGQYCFIGAGAVVTQDVAAFALMLGVPARQVGWMSAFGERLDLPLTGSGKTECPHDGSHYELDGDVLIRRAAGV